MSQTSKTNTVVRTLEGHDPNIRILSKESEAFFRQSYQHAFLDIKSPLYADRIVKLIEIDGESYQTSYMRYILRNAKLISLSESIEILTNHTKVLVIWDVNAVDYKYHDNYWKFGTWTIIEVTPEYLLSIDSDLPEDYYVFDCELSWSIVFTHDYDDKLSDDDSQIRHIYYCTNRC